MSEGPKPNIAPLFLGDIGNRQGFIFHGRHAASNARRNFSGGDVNLLGHVSVP